MYKDILIPIDMSDEKTWRDPLQTAIVFARQFGSRLHIMMVVPSFQSPLVGSFFPKHYEQQMHEQADREIHTFVQQQVPAELAVQTIVAVGTIYEEVINAAEQLHCDLIIMGRSGTSKANFLLGPNAARVMRHANTSVLIAHDAG